MFTVYVLRTSLGTLYTGYTSNLEKRLKEHQDKKGRGSKYMRAFDSFELVHTEVYETKQEAMSREASIKKMTKTKKEKIIAGVWD